MIFTITDVNNNPIKELNLGMLADNEVFRFRLHNNLNGAVQTPIQNAYHISLDIVAKSHHTSNLTFARKIHEGRCVYSAKMQSVVNEGWSKFPITSENYDVIKNGEYNEYEVKHNYSLLSDSEKDFLRNKQMTYWILVAGGAY